MLRGQGQYPKFGGTNAQGDFRVGGLEGGDSLGEIANTKPSPHACQWCVGCPQPWPWGVGCKKCTAGQDACVGAAGERRTPFKIPENRKQENSEQEIHKKSHKKSHKNKKSSPNVDVGGVCNCVGDHEGITMRVGGFRLWNPLGH